jgi:hypothetical protein
MVSLAKARHPRQAGKLKWWLTAATAQPLATSSAEIVLEWNGRPLEFRQFRAGQEALKTHLICSILPVMAWRGSVPNSQASEAEYMLFLRVFRGLSQPPAAALFTAGPLSTWQITTYRKTAVLK